MDDWPEEWQYRIATGYGCPDSASVCNSEYYGFFNQVYLAAKQFKRYVAQPGTFNYAAGRRSFIAYQANNAGCGGTDVTIQNGATAALYNYTPYQPNGAALANLYGTGDGCSAYGNRNFWRLFNDWFGPTTGDGYSLIRNEDDNSQWVYYRGIKQYVPSAEIKQAWGLPDETIAFSGHAIAGIPTGPPLGRLFHRIGDPALYFADGGKKYRVPSIEMRDTFGFTGQSESYVSQGLWSLPQDVGYLSYSVKKASNPALYMAEGINGSGQMALRQYSDPNVFTAWEGDNARITTLSDTYFDQIDNAIGSALTGYTAKGSGASQYQVVAGQKLYLSGEIAGVFNQSYQTVSDATISRLYNSSPATNFIRLPGDGVTIYMVDNGQKLPISSGDVLRAWSPSNNINVNILNQGFLNLLATGDTISSYEADVSGQLFLVDGHKHTVPAALDNGYRNGTVASVSTALMNLFPTRVATGFIKGSGPSVYLVDAGTRKHITSLETWKLWNGDRGEAITQVAEPVLAQLSDGGAANFYFSSGGTQYVMDNGTYHSVTSPVATDWNLSSPTAISTATRDRFTAGAALQTKVKVGSTYYRVKYGTNNGTSDTNLATVWGLATSPTDVTSSLVARTTAGPNLNLFAKSTDGNDHRIFLVDNGATDYYHLNSVEQLLNFGYNGGGVVAVSPSDLGTPGVAQNIIKTATADTERIVDIGAKRDFSNSTVKGRWVTGSNVLTVSSAFYNRLGSGTSVTGNIKGSNTPHVYNIDTGQKRWITTQSSYQTYATDYGAYSDVSSWLAAVIPTGTDIQ
jgi:hypothetical protein